METDVSVAGNPVRSLAEGVSSADKPVRVLVAEDNLVFQSILRTILVRWGYDVVATRNGLHAWELLAGAGAPQLAILDWMMPGIDGVEICRRLRATSRDSYTYVLLLTARTDASDLVEGMDAGADDYLTKPLKSHELRVRLRAGCRIIELQQQLLQAREALRLQATHDGLTGLLNRNAIVQSLEQELARACRESQALSVLMLDLDRFKEVNDGHGHLAGDAVLREAANRMRRCIRKYDAVGRYGGEEFLFVLPGCDGARAFTEADRVREAIAASAFDIPGGSIPVTCSIGVGSHNDGTPPDADSLLRDADAALYAAKHLGRNRVATAAQACITA